MTAAQSRFGTSPEKRLLLPMRSPVSWTRAVLYDKRGFVMIIDHLVAFAKHELKATWNLHPDAGDTFLQMHSTGGEPFSHAYSPARAEPEPDGYYSPDYNIKHPAPKYTFSTTIDRPTTLYTVVDGETQPENGIYLEVHSRPGAKTFRFSVHNRSGILATAAIDLFPEPSLVEYTFPQ